ncbi:MAG: DEAD/DEAH box helicase family protein [Acidimicrobiales bacterium]|nr:DEAD/DEAH box helicase family protein [Acidimicrobiales bacterium]
MLEAGLYDELVTEALAAQLTEDAATEAVDPADAPHRLAEHIGRVLHREFPGLDADEAHALTRRVLELAGTSGHAPTEPLTALRGVGRRNSTGDLVLPDRPQVPLGQHDLLVNATGEPQLANELKKEIASADRVDLIVAFVRWYGVRLIIDELTAALDRGVAVRLLTTTYTGSTERNALDRLAELGVDIQVSYDTAVTRLHAKAWVFHRNTGFSTAYVGSSNITRSAMLDGREWNLRVSKAASPALFDKVATAFDANWASADFEAYDPGRDADRLDDALERGSGRRDEASALSGLTLTPWPYQQEILDAIESARTIHGSYRNLVVAPTGTGKTVVAALDYRRLAQQADDELSLLFVAHREQILDQSRRTFREALLEPSFGEKLVGGERPSEGTHVFASIQSLHSLGAEHLDPTGFDVVIVDEFHHAEAATYRAVLDHLEPEVLLALTATPERADGLDVRRWTDGRTAFDMRLWHALDRQLLAPFQYFGVADIVDPDAAWSRGAYRSAELGSLYTGNDARAQLVLRQVGKIVADPKSMKALGFCATVDHAEFMAERFSAAGLASVALSGDDPQRVREQAIARLRSGEIVAIFTRDIFNEGVDIPDVDTILLLRPTESATVFLQQIGRGLRRHPGKDVCTILDFVANYRREFRFDLRLRALTGIARRDLVDAAEEGFPYLPTGSHLSLDRQSREWIIEHLKQSVRTNARALRNELSLLTQLQDERPTLRTFVAEAGIDVEDVGKAGGWAALQRAAGLDVPEPGPDEDRLQKGIRRLVHLDDSERIDTLLDRLRTGALPDTERERRVLWMALVTLWTGRAAPDSMDEAWDRLRACPALVDELEETLPIVRDRITHLSHRAARRRRAAPDRRHLRPRRDPRRVRRAHARALLLPPGRAVVARAGPDRGAVHHAAQDREGLQPRDHVPGLRHQPRPVPLGVTALHGDRLQGRPALPQPAHQRRPHPAGGAGGQAGPVGSDHALRAPRPRRLRHPRRRTPHRHHLAPPEPDPSRGLRALQGGGGMNGDSAQPWDGNRGQYPPKADSRSLSPAP